jgi:hypothetical protein
MHSTFLLALYSSLFAKYAKYSPGYLPVANGADEYDDADQVASAVPVHRNGNF